MAVLKDYLGSLIRDITYSRVIADQESANIAKMYETDDLLKYFSITFSIFPLIYLSALKRVILFWKVPSKE